MTRAFKHHNTQILFFALILAVNVNAFSQENNLTRVPLSTIFNNFGENLWDSVTYNFGLNLGLSIVGTYSIIETGLDWKYYQAVYGNRALTNYGLTVNITGYAAPVIFPLAAYAAGIFSNDEKLQVLGAALAQTTIIATGMNIVMKGITGRRQAGIYDLDPQETDYSNDFSFGFFRGGTIDGWPSGHTMNAVASAIVISELYKDKLLVRIAAFAYAGVLSIGMTFFDHWLSDVVAGWILGYGIGKTVGKSFANLENSGKQNISFDLRRNYFGIRIVM